MHLSTFNTSSKNITSSFLPSGRNLHTINTSDRKADVISPLAEKSASPLTSATTPTPTTSKHKFNGSQIFLHKSQKLLGLLNDTKSILGSYREVNKEKWHIQYPFVRPQPLVGQQIFSKDDHGTNSFIGNNLSIRKALSSIDASSKFREQIRTKLYTPQPDMSSSQEINAILSVLNLDLKKGDRSSAENVVEKLDKGSVATLLDERLIHSVKRIENLASRVADTSSKVLVAGDVNAGKSTFVNALLRREIMPVDQQPCTTLFCEVRDVRENSDKEEVHAIRNIEKYNREDASTYTAIDFENLFDMISSGTEEYTQLKVYCKDKRDVQQSLLHNGIVDIALIDCPGLNRDTLKTTALFARQEEIDVIVFVVSAENHFTLSAKEFLSNASSEKAYIFIVVNRFDNIRNKEKCKRLVLDQIKEVSPRTYEHANDLVHFVTSTAIPNESEEANSLDSLNPIDKQRIDDFNCLEESLRTFILKKRSKSKLDPAQHYLDNLIIDVGVLAEFNRAIATIDAEKTSRELQDGEKAFEKLCNDEKHIGEKAEKCVEDTCDSIASFTKRKLEQAIISIDQSVTNTGYPGLLYVWAYANDVRDAMLDEISKEVQASEMNAKNETILCIKKIQSMGDYLEGNPREINLGTMYKRDRNSISINISLADFVDFNFDKKVNDSLSIVGFSGCTAFAVATKLNFLPSLWRITSFIGLKNMRKLALPLTVVAGVGVVAFVLYDLERIVSRNIARKVRQQLVQSQYIDSEVNRIVRQGRRKMRLATDNLRLRFRRAVEEEEKKRAVTQSVYVKSKEAVRFFEEILEKAEKMVDILDALGHDWDDMED